MSGYGVFLSQAKFLGSLRDSWKARAPNDR